MTVNTTELSRKMPRNNLRAESNSRVIFRFIANSNVSAEIVMAPLAQALISEQNKLDGKVVFLMNQSKVKHERECLMISIRLGKRAVPFVWLSVKTKGSIGFNKQKILLDAFCRMLPEGTNVFFTADRFYGHNKLIDYYSQRKWQYRIRLKGNQYVYHEGRKLKTGNIPITNEENPGLSKC